MSHIDEAFIQAYSPQQPTQVPGAGEVPVVPMQPPLAGLHHGPKIRPQDPVSPAKQPIAASQSVVTQSTVTQQRLHSSNEPSAPATGMTSQPHWSPEPIPAPHIQFASPANSTTVAEPPPVTTPVEQPTTDKNPSSNVESLPAQERRPLSAFSAPETPPSTAFNPVFEVDAFRWPKITNELLTAHHELLIPVADHLLDVCEQGRSLVGLAGTRPNVGCSTLMLSLARLVGSLGKTVALVDANFTKASLGRDLGLEFGAGWESALKGELPLAECVVKSLDDQMALLPLAQTHTQTNGLLGSIHTSVTAGVLRYHYDLVLFNLGAAAEEHQDEAAYHVMQHCRLDANIIVADSEDTGIAPMDTLLSLFGDTCLGVIGNSAA